jgi:hypothetical protein
MQLLRVHIPCNLNTSAEKLQYLALWCGQAALLEVSGNVNQRATSDR